jgi:PPP family 3-phenylpropionic acid transporter
MFANNSWLNFLGITMKQMGASDGLVGTAWSLGAVAEVPVMWFGIRFIVRLGAKKMIALGFFFYGLRLFLYAIMPNPEWVLAINLLHGLSFGFYWLGGVNYVSQITPEALRATGQSLLATFFNIASLSAGPINGWMFDNYGSSRLYLVAALTAWMGVTLFASATYLLDWRQRGWSLTGNRQ